jgi:hypothetical protein
MWSYEKRLQYPINITTPNAKLASYIMSQYGGPDGDDIDIINLNQQESRKKAGFRRFGPEKNSQRKQRFLHRTESARMGHACATGKERTYIWLP